MGWRSDRSPQKEISDWQVELANDLEAQSYLALMNACSYCVYCEASLQFAYKYSRREPRRQTQVIRRAAIGWLSLLKRQHDPK